MAAKTPTELTIFPSNWILHPAETAKKGRSPVVFCCVAADVSSRPAALWRMNTGCMTVHPCDTIAPHIELSGYPNTSSTAAAVINAACVQKATVCIIAVYCQISSLPLHTHILQEYCGCAHLATLTRDFKPCLSLHYCSIIAKDL